MAAGIAAGIYRDYGDAVKRTVKITKTVLPRPLYKEVYEEKYRTYRAVIEGLGGTWERFRIE